MFYRLDKFNGPIFGEGVYMWGPYIWDVDWLPDLGAYIQGGSRGLCMGGVLTGFYGTLKTIVSRFTQKKKYKIIEEIWS